MPKKRGRKSAADLNVIQFLPKKPDPPAELTDDQAAIWRDLVNGESEPFFAARGARALLAMYCEHKATADKLNASIASVPVDQALRTESGMKRITEMLKLRERETRVCLTILTKLRLTNQARWQPKSATVAAESDPTANDDRPPPWEC